MNAYVAFLADPYPGFRLSRLYPVDLAIAPPARQNRWKTGFRLILALPAALVNQVLSYLGLVIGVFAWFACLVTGAMPRGLQDLSTWILRFGAQTNAYAFLLTGRYPSFSTDTAR